MKGHEWLIVPALIMPAVICNPAFAAHYLSVEQAQKALFPEATHFAPTNVTLTPEIKRQVEQASGVRVRSAMQPVWRAEAGGKMIGWFVLDEVIGKHELITYAVALGMDGAVQGVEILDYRETRGAEVRNPRWRAQFTGKKPGDALQLDEDIKNISGATLSCRSMTNGIKRVLATYQAALK